MKEEEEDEVIMMDGNWIQPGIARDALHAPFFPSTLNKVEVLQIFKELDSY